MADIILTHKIVQTISDVFEGNFQNLRILDLACLHGDYAIDLALMGATTVGIEGREENIRPGIEKKEKLCLTNCNFFVDDVRNATIEKYGSFDVVLCCGILYHMNQPDVFYLLENIFKMCKKLLFIDTLISLIPNQLIFHREQKYYGLNYVEFSENDTPEKKLKDNLSALDNNYSFWFTKPSLCNLLINTGFTTIFELASPPPHGYLDRILLTALKGKNQTIKSLNGDEFNISSNELMKNLFLSENPEGSYIFDTEMLGAMDKFSTNNQIQSLWEYAKKLFEKEEYAQAELIFNDLDKLSEEKDNILYWKSLCFYKRGLYRESLELISTNIEKVKHGKDLYILLADCLEKLGDEKSAEKVRKTIKQKFN